MCEKSFNPEEKEKIYKLCEKEINSGIKEFFDTKDGILAEAIMELKEKYTDLRLYLPENIKESDGKIKIF